MRTIVSDWAYPNEVSRVDRGLDVGLEGCGIEAARVYLMPMDPLQPRALAAKTACASSVRSGLPASAVRPGCRTPSPGRSRSSHREVLPRAMTRQTATGFPVTWALPDGN